MTQPFSVLKRLGWTVFEFFLPRLCVFCGGMVALEAGAAVCADCEGKIEWVTSPMCPCCGRVFASREGPDHLCGPCLAEPPPFRRARAAALYEEPVSRAITRFKFGRQMAYLPVLQHWLLSRPHCREMVEEADLLLPVPLHPRRLKARGFNQALLLTEKVSLAKTRELSHAKTQRRKDNKKNKFLAPLRLCVRFYFLLAPLRLCVRYSLLREAVVRVRHTVPQIGLNPKERRDNVQGAFAVPRPELVKGKKVLLIDDLYTTGATAKECSRALLKAGARQVEVLTVARVRYE